MKFGTGNFNFNTIISNLCILMLPQQVAEDLSYVIAGVAASNIPKTAAGII